MPRLFVALSLILALGLPSALAAAPDDNEACAHMVPEGLRNQVLKDYPHYRFVRVDDYSSDDIQSERQYHGGSACLAAASGDYFGDGQLAYAFILLSDSSAIFIVARAHGLRWDVTQLGNVQHGDYRKLKGAFNLYLATVPPGNYSDIGLGDSATETSDWRQDIASKSPGVAIGIIEATEDVFFFENGHWVFTNVQD